MWILSVHYNLKKTSSHYFVFYCNLSKKYYCIPRLIIVIYNPKRKIGLKRLKEEDLHIRVRIFVLQVNLRNFAD